MTITEDSVIGKCQQGCKSVHLSDWYPDRRVSIPLASIDSILVGDPTPLTREQKREQFYNGLAAAALIALFLYVFATHD
ncbi:MAG TPA: hypothetical protein VLV16_14960 [Gemmatimonadales bacterium]|nr:hypothetical protein [Gemmatimonadales bacterium]